MKTYFADLHIHIGQAGGQAVKITASRALQLNSIIYQDAPNKGLDIVGVVDAACLPVTREIAAMLEQGGLRELPRGGFLAGNGVLFIPAAEVETREGVHMIMYLPTLDSIHTYQKYIRSRVKNLSLSTQKASTTIQELINLQYLVNGLLCPAHVFTPHKGVYGCCTRRLSDLLGRDYLSIKAVELGLSADTIMGDLIEECRHYTFLSNSDAHSSGNIGREYNLLRMNDKSFAELRLCLENQEGRKVVANYGMDPLMGKYHRSYCPGCKYIIDKPEPAFSCPLCASTSVVNGVYDRIMDIRDYDHPHHPIGRPVYNYRVPLKELPGLGPRGIQKLLQAFGSEIEIVETADPEQIARIAGEGVARMIRRMREDRLPIKPGGGGLFGKVAPPSEW